MHPDLIPPHRRTPPIPAAFISEKRIHHLTGALKSIEPLPHKSEQWVYTVLCQLLTRDQMSFNRHKLNPDDISLDSRRLIAWFCHRPELRMEIMQRYFEIDDFYNPAAGITKGYRVKDEFRDVLARAELDYVPELGSTSVPYLYPFSKQPRGWFLRVKPLLEVDVDSLFRLRDAASYVEGKLFIGEGAALPLQYAGLSPNLLTGHEYKAPRILATLNTLIEMIDNNGYIRQGFRQSQAGRYYAIGTSLQNVYKVVRYAALEDRYSYDIEACHHGIALDVAKRNCLPRKYISMYLDDKSSFRSSLAGDLKCNIETIKSVLLAITYGAGIHPYGSVRALLGVDGFELAKKSKLFRGLYNELQSVGDFMIHEAMRTVRVDSHGAKYIWNKAGLVLNITDKPKRAQILAHLMQGIESLMLQAAISVHKSTVLPLHDGWVTQAEESPCKARNAIKKATGIDVKISVDSYKLSPTTSY